MSAPIASVLAALPASAPLCEKRALVRFAVAANMQPHLPGFGKGSKAARRVVKIGEGVAAYCRALNARIEAARKRRAGDEMSEYVPESRSHSHRYRTNIHGD